MQISGTSMYGGMDPSRFMPSVRGKPPSASEVAEFQIQQNDSDGDEMLSVSETGLEEEVFSTIDSDSDGLLSLEELSAYGESRQAEMQAQGPPPPPPGGQGMGMPSVSEMASSILEDNDEDEDGLLSVSESGLSEELFAAIDSDEDGLLSSSEIETDLESRSAEMRPPGPPPGPPPGVQGMGMPSASEIVSSLLAENDSDEDGLLSVSESGLSEELFAAIDSDEDGLLSREEIELDIETRHAEMQEQGFSPGMSSAGLRHGGMSMNASDLASFFSQNATATSSFATAI